MTFSPGQKIFDPLPLVVSQAMCDHVWIFEARSLLLPVKKDALLLKPTAPGPEPLRRLVARSEIPSVG